MDINVDIIFKIAATKSTVTSFISKSFKYLSFLSLSHIPYPPYNRIYRKFL
jgi:hypothetical protein